MIGFGQAPQFWWQHLAMSPSEHPQALRQTYRLRNRVTSLDTGSEAFTFRYSSNIHAQVSEESNYPYGMNLVGYSTSI